MLHVRNALSDPISIGICSYPSHIQLRLPHASFISQRSAAI